MTDHTPGPWCFFHRWEKDGNMTIAEVYRKTGERLFGVELTETIVRFPYFRTRAEHAQAEANAHLIAAAPDLLAALEYALDAISFAANAEPLESDCEHWDSVLKVAKAAIAKAKGEMP